MATKKGNPRGYVDKVLAIDCETTGLCFGVDNPVHNPKTGEHHQSVSWGIIVADAHTLKPIEELYVEIKWNEASINQRKRNSKFGKKAEEIHGLTREYLDKNGLSEEDAIEQIGSLIVKHFGTNSVICLGHNVHTFDMPFLRDLFRRHGIELKFGNRHMDTNSVGFIALETYNSDQLFELCGFDARGAHNSLDDAKMALESARTIRVITKASIG